MTETTVELEIPLLIPRFPKQCDGCTRRFLALLSEQKGVLKAHLEEEHPQTLCLHYDPGLVNIDRIRSIAEKTGAQIASRYHHIQLPVEGMDCSDCAIVLEHGLQRMDGILSASVQYAAQTMDIEFDAQRVNRTSVERKIRQLGYRVTPAPRQKWIARNAELLLSLLAGILTAAGWLLARNQSQIPWLSWSVFLLAYLAGGWNVSRHAWHALREKHFDTDLLMVMAALGASALGKFAEGGLLLFLFSLGHALEERALDKARSAIQALGNLHPKTALVRRNGAEQEISVDEVVIGDRVVIRPGQRIAVDGAVVSGVSTVDQSPITGESIPAEKFPGTPVLAGTINGEGLLEVAVTRLSRDTTLAKVIQLVQEAQGQKSRTQAAIDGFAGRFVPAILVLVLLVIAVPLLFGMPFRESFMRAMILLVAASPCALALGAPAATLAGIACAARGGVLVKGGAHLENLGRVNTLAFDKTGTLTSGRPQLVQIIPLNNQSPDELLAILAALESHSGHPFALAIQAAAARESLATPMVSALRSLTGFGIRGVLAGKTVSAGNAALMAQSDVCITPEVQAAARKLEQEGCNLIYLSMDDRLAGMFAIADTIRPEAPQAVRALKHMGVQDILMLTGDGASAAGKVAAETGIAKVHAGLLPEEKLQIIESYTRQNRGIAMVGDGVNDAPALARATIGVAMGGAGTDVALETADVVLLGNDLRRLVFAIRTGRETRKVVYQNIWIAGLVIIVLMAAALTGNTGIGTAVVFHEGSTLLVVANALRLLTLKEPAVPL